MNTIDLKSDFKIIFLNIFFSLIPLSFIVGNLFLNANIIILILLSIFFFRLKILKIQINFTDKIIFFFFGYAFLVGITNYTEYYNSRSTDVSLYLLGKSFFYLRYVFLYIVIRYLIEKKFLNLKWFFFSSSFFCIFVCLDIFYQFYSGQSILGYEPVTKRTLSGPFGGETIAGGYIQRFFIFFIFLILGFFGNKKNYSTIIITIFIGIVSVGIIFSGNRMPFVLFTMMLFLFALFEKKIRSSFFFIFSVLLIAFYFLPSNSDIRKNVGDFKMQTKKMITFAITWNVERDEVYKPLNDKLPIYFSEFETFYDTWLMNKNIGGGIRSFRINCTDRDNIKLSERSTCNTHPHNYYLEILTDLGLIGLIIILILFSNIFYQSLIRIKFIHGNFLLPFIFIFIAEIFPFKSTGSFFTTMNSTFLFLILSILVGLSHQKISDKNYIL